MLQKDFGDEVISQKMFTGIAFIEGRESVEKEQADNHRRQFMNNM